MPCSIEHRRAVGDTLAKLAVTIQNNGTARDLTGLTVKFYMVDDEGNVAIAPTAATVTDDTAGQVEYDFTALQVAEEGEFYGWFKVYGGVAGTEPDTYPDDEDGIHIVIFSETPVHTTPDPSVLTATEIAEMARAPRRTRTVEGTVEERSIADLIKADQYAASKGADGAPWGMRIAKTKPPSTLS